MLRCPPRNVLQSHVSQPELLGADSAGSSYDLGHGARAVSAHARLFAFEQWAARAIRRSRRKMPAFSPIRGTNIVYLLVQHAGSADSVPVLTRPDSLIKLEIVSRRTSARVPALRIRLPKPFGSRGMTLQCHYPKGRA